MFNRIFLVLAQTLGLSLAVSSASADPNFWKFEWPKTNFEQTSVSSWIEIMSGGPPKDGIPALNNPDFGKASEETRIGGREPVITVDINGDVRAYPVRYLTWHEIANDTVGGVPVAVTFCPLCNSGITFDRRIPQGTLTFGVSGKLRNSDMVMFDRETESWWQQAVGEAIVGDLLGAQLKQLPTWMESWDEYRTRHPDGLVMLEPDFPRRYGRNPYVSYDSSTKPFLYNGEMPPHGIPALERVVRVGESAWPLTRLATLEQVTENGITLSWAAGQASALDAPQIGKGRDVGTVRVRDQAGNDLPHDVMFAFAFHAFWPEGDWMLGE
ncbi:DUF3179 domain-containing protein [Planktotalea arctica]|uniref:DUF3179 domain-containing protein n=1 Tax=Planktotalea arctica TaxID=1481893 RepID=UPI000A170269|nr:DUF3179 domain-containing protein [Planktotalea arctica]